MGVFRIRHVVTDHEVAAARKTVRGGPVVGRRYVGNLRVECLPIDEDPLSNDRDVVVGAYTEGLPARTVDGDDTVMD